MEWDFPDLWYEVVLGFGTEEGSLGPLGSDGLLAIRRAQGEGNGLAAKWEAI